MGENSKQMNSDSIFVHKTISDVLAEVSKIHDFSLKSLKLDFYVNSLEEETRKVDAFKRELPLCMHLLQDAVDTLKKEKVKLKEEKGKGPMMEEFMDGRAKSSNDFIEEKNWMSSAQLWISTPVHSEQSNKNQDSVLSLKSKQQEEESSGSESQFNLKNRGGGAFVPFKKPSGVLIQEEKRAVLPAHGLSFSVPVYSMEPIDDSGPKEARRDLVGPQQEQQRKQRRCWSPELHRIFVDALLQLGGPNMATPKQIREVMKVEGLTNDEVKSHLQKYRLHVRKVPVPGAAAGIMDLPFFRLHDHHHDGGSSSNQVVANSGSPQDHLHLGGALARGGGSNTSAETIEEDDDQKSESHSWKGRFQKPDEGRD